MRKHKYIVTKLQLTLFLLQQFITWKTLFIFRLVEPKGLLTTHSSFWVLVPICS